MINSLMWAVGILLVVAPFAYLLRRNAVGVTLTVLTLVYATYQIGQIDPLESDRILGRPFQLSPFSQATLIIVFLSTALLCLIAHFSPTFVQERAKRVALGQVKVGRLEANTERILYPVGLVSGAVLLLAVSIQHLGISAVLMQIGAVLAVFIIQGSRVGTTRASLRFLTLISLATPLLLLAAWQIDFAEQFDESLTTTDSIAQISLLAGLGFAIWVGVVPFHGGLTATMRDSQPASAVFVLLTFPLLGLAIWFNFLANYPFPLEFRSFQQAIVWGGISTAMLGAIFCAVQRNYGGAIGYAALYQLGTLIILFGVNPTEVAPNFLLTFITRATALALLAASLAIVRGRFGDDGFVHLTGTAYQTPFATLGFIVGGLSLAGQPLTGGFDGKWAVLSQVLAYDWRMVVLLGGASLGVAIGFLRGLRHTLQPTSASQSVNQEPAFLAVIVSVMMGVLIVAGLMF